MVNDTVDRIHKENNPGRPVNNSNNCPTSEILRFVKEIPSYIKDTNDFVKKINNFKVPKYPFLVTMDVKAAVKRKHDNYTSKTVATKVTAIFLALIFTINNLNFNLKFYLQIKDCAMGTICAPTYANTFISEFKERYIYPLIKSKSSSYLRFIDNIFMILNKSENELIRALLAIFYGFEQIRKRA